MKFLFPCALVLASSLAVSSQAADPPSARQELTDVFRVTPNLARGGRLFSACISCHGRDGREGAQHEAGH